MMPSVILILVGLCTAQEPPAYWAIHSPERVFTRAQLLATLREAEQSKQDLDFVRALAQQATSHPKLAKKMLELFRQTGGQKPFLGDMLKRSGLGARAKDLAERLAQDEQLKERFLNDRELQRLARELAPDLAASIPSQRNVRAPASDRTHQMSTAILDQSRATATDPEQRDDRTPRPPGLQQRHAAGSDSPPSNPTMERLKHTWNNWLGKENDKPRRADSGAGVDRPHRWDSTASSHATTPQSLASDLLLRAGEKLKNLGSPFAESQALQKAIGDLESRKLTNADQRTTSIHQQASQLISSSLASLRPWSEHLRYHGTETGQLIRRKLPTIPDIPIPASLRMPGSWIPRISLSAPNESVVSLSGLGFGGIDFWMWAALATAGLAASAALAVHYLRPVVRRRQIQRVCRQRLENLALSDRERIQQLFEHLALATLGESARANHHRRIAGRLGATMWAQKFAELYELARYSPSEEDVDSKMLTHARECSEAVLRERAF